MRMQFITNTSLNFPFFLLRFEAFAVFGSDLTPRLGSLRAARFLHDGLLRVILRVPVTFFDQTPTGRILGRFSSDQFVLDVQLPEIIADFQFCLYEVTQIVCRFCEETQNFLKRLPLKFSRNCSHCKQQNAKRILRWVFKGFISP